MEHSAEAIAEFKQLNPNAISHIKSITGDTVALNLRTPHSSLSPVLSSIICSMSSHGEEATVPISPQTKMVPLIRPDEPFGIASDDSSEEAQAPLPILPCETPPLSAASQLHPLLATVGPLEARQRATLAALLRIWATASVVTGGNSNNDIVDIDQIFTISSQPIPTEATEDHPNPTVLELEHV